MKLNKIQKKFVSENKSKQTESEISMSKKLKEFHIQFIKQFVINKDKSFIICDFYLPQSNTIIEVDGGYHLTKEQRKKDIERDKFLIENKYNVVRVKNEDVHLFDASPFMRLKRYSKPTNKKFKEIKPTKTKLQLYEAKLLKSEKLRVEKQKRELWFKIEYPHLCK